MKESFVTVEGVKKIAKQAEVSTKVCLRTVFKPKKKALA